MQQIRILQSEIGSGIGGIESFLYSVYSHMDRDRYHFDFITRAEHPAFEKEFTEMDSRFYHVASYKHPAKYMRDMKNVLANGYDVVHINKNSAADILPFIAARKYSKAKVVAHAHNASPSVGKVTSLLHGINRSRLYRLSDVHLACSDAAGRWMYGNRDFRFIPNGIDVQKFRFNEDIRTRYRQDLGLGDAFTLINVGRFFPQKNQLRLIDIFSKVVKMRPDSRLLLIGSGEMEKDIRHRVSEYSLEDKVIFTGHRQDVNGLLMAADCFVMTSVYEGLPISLIEAQAAGLSVFSSDEVSTEVRVTDDFHFFSISDSDDEIANLISLSEKKASSMREKDNDKVETSDYNITRTVERLMRIYDICSNGNI